MNAHYGSLLVMDDNDIYRDMLACRLAERGYTVACAENGHQALEMVETQTFDLVLLDITMPGISGLEVLKILRQRYTVADLPVIMATAIGHSEDIVQALNLGASDYVTKPLAFSVILARIQTQITLKRAVEEIRRLVQQLELRNRFIQETFGRYLTDEVVANLLETPERLQLGGEKRKVTMLMSDLRGFTPLSERLAPEQVVALLNRYLGTMIEVIVRYQGTINDFLGDAILVIFGAPFWREDDAQRAVACAVAMQLAMSSVNEQNRREGLPEVEMGIGVNTGEVVVGNIGSHQRTKYDVVGSHVNLTFRIESYAVGGQILISEATLTDAGPTVRIYESMEVEVKGFEKSLILYDLWGIGEKYNLFLPERREDALLHLQEEIPVQYTVLTENCLGRTVFMGRLVKLSARGGEVRSDLPVAPLSNIKMRLTSMHGEEVLGDLYGKVVGEPSDGSTGFSVRFTSISPEAAAFLHSVLVL